MNNPDVGNAQRRLDEMEERLERFEAGEPPEGLLESIQEEIPVDLGAERGTGGPSRLSPTWRRMAASLAVVALGGLLGYAVLRVGPTVEETVEQSLAEQATGSPLERTGRTDGPTELGEAQSTVPTREALDGLASVGHLDGSESSSGLTEAGNDQEPSSAEQNRQSRNDKLSDRREALKQTTEVMVDRINVGGSDTGQQADFRARGVTGNKIEARATELGEAAAGRESDSKSKNRPEAAEVLAAAQPTEEVERAARRSEEVPKPGSLRLDPDQVTRGVSPSDVDLEAIPDARDPSAANEVKQSATAVRVDPQARAELLRKRRQELVDRLNHLGSGSGPPSTGGTSEPNDQPYGDMFFQGYGTNPFIDTEDDAQSTFGIDVDTASYTLARSYLQRGNLPPADAIRVEEFVNFFDYGDPAPRNRDFAVVAEGAPSPFASTARTYLLRFALKGREIDASQRKPAVLTFVVDVSGSMNRENRLGLVKRSLRLLVDQLDSGDAIGLVVYGSHGQVILEPTSDHSRVLAAIERLRPGGSTNAEQGLVLGYQTARKYFRPNAINRVILCSDGVANVGATGPESILQRIGSEAENGIELTTVGFGMGNYNDVLMEQLADKGDGNYAYVDDLDEARRVFVENLTGTLQTIAGDAKIQVEFDKQVVQSYRLLGYENRDIADRDFRNDAVDAGEIGGGHQVTALYEVKLRPDVVRRGDIATLRLRYKSKSSGRVVEDSVVLRQADLAGSWRRASHGLKVAATAAEFAEILKGSYWARESGLRDLAERARGLVRGDRWSSESGGRELAELATLIERAAQLRESAPAGFEGGFEDGIER